MGLYQKIREVWKKPKENLGADFKEYLIQWRREPVTVKLDRPTRLDRARSLGYKAKQGVIVVRQRVSVSRRMREQPAGGRRPKTSRRKKVVAKNFQQIAEERAAKKFVNLEVLNSYHLASDSVHHWYEIIFVDTKHPVIKSDKNLKVFGEKQHKGRVFRGLTSAARKSRGLRNSKGIGAEKVRPSNRANSRKAK